MSAGLRSFLRRLAWWKRPQSMEMRFGKLPPHKWNPVYEPSDAWDAVAAAARRDDAYVRYEFVWDDDVPDLREGKE